MKKYLSILGITILVYLIPEILFEDALLYLTGGVIGGTIKEVLSDTSGKPSDNTVYLIWLLILSLFVGVVYLVKNRIARYFVLFIIAFLLYVFDFLLFKLVSVDGPDVFGAYILISIRILIKGIILSLLIYYGTSKKLLISQK